jgi:hypothetical protein
LLAVKNGAALSDSEFLLHSHGEKVGFAVAKITHFRNLTVVNKQTRKFLWATRQYTANYYLFILFAY